MAMILFTCLIVCFAIGNSSSLSQDRKKQRALVSEFFETMNKYHPQTYKKSHKLGSSAANYAVQKERFKCFCKTKKDIDRVNKDDDLPYNAAVNKFTTLTDKEWDLHNGGVNNSLLEKDTKEEKLIAIKAPLELGSGHLPESVYWVKNGGMKTDVLDRGECNNPGSFAITAAMEAAYKKVRTNTRLITHFSEQELIDCAANSDCLWNCKYGSVKEMIEYLHKANGFISSRDYRQHWHKKAGSCKIERERLRSSMTEAYVAGYEKYEGDCGLRKAVSKGVAIVHFRLFDSFKSYSNGIYTEPAYAPRTRIRGQTVLAIVGYGRDRDTKRRFWTARNSFGTDWGEHGYMRVTGDHDNHCDISSHVYLPILKQGNTGNGGTDFTVIDHGNSPSFNGECGCEDHDAVLCRFTDMCYEPYMKSACRRSCGADQCS